MAAYFLFDDIIEDNIVTKQRKLKVFKNRTRHLDSLDDRELFARFRMPRHAIEQLIDTVRPHIERETQRSLPLSPELQLLVTLRILAKGGFQSEIADLHGVSQSSISRSITSTVNSFSRHLNFIHFPRDAAARRTVKEAFHKISGFPNVLGCVDGTLIPIMRPSADEEMAFVCRKGFHALNVQAICDADLRFTNVVCRWPGGTHDSFIFNNSQIAAYLERQGGAEGWLLGDSGYACRPWLLTPLTTPQSDGEERYNKAHCKTRNSVERAFGLMKSRFRCLHKTTCCLPFKSDKCQRLVYAVCNLHNFCINLRLPDPPLPVEDNDADDGNNPYLGPQDGFQVRNSLIRNVFT